MKALLFVLLQVLSYEVFFNWRPCRNESKVVCLTQLEETLHAFQYIFVSLPWTNYGSINFRIDPAKFVRLTETLRVVQKLDVIALFVLRPLIWFQWGEDDRSSFIRQCLHQARQCSMLVSVPPHANFIPIQYPPFAPFPISPPPP